MTIVSVYLQCSHFSSRESLKDNGEQPDIGCLSKKEAWVQHWRKHDACTFDIVTNQHRLFPPSLDIICIIFGFVFVSGQTLLETTFHTPTRNEEDWKYWMSEILIKIILSRSGSKVLLFVHFICLSWQEERILRLFLFLLRLLLVPLILLIPEQTLKG